MSAIRVLIVDDAVVVRRVLTETLEADPEIEVVGAAANGKLALPKVTQLKPDVVVLDIEMPEMDGITTLREIRKIDRRLPVIMFSTLTERGAAATLEALAAGASDYATKPTNTSAVAGAEEQLRTELIPKIKSFGARAKAGAPGRPAEERPRRAAREDFSGRPPRRELDAAPKAAATISLRTATAGSAPRVDIVAIGISTGGPNALADMMPKLPRDLSVPIVIVQHMPPTFTRLLAERLDKTCPLKVVEAGAGMTLTAGTAYIAPGDQHMVLKRSGASVVIELNQGPPENSCRPAADVMFRSVAEVYGANALGIVMTGMGQDGFRGAQKMAEKGARILAQDEATSVVWGMPSFVAKAGIADAVLPLKDIAGEIAKRVATGRAGTPASVTAGGSR